MTGSLTKHSVVIAGHKTSFSLEDEFWLALKQIAKKQNISLSALVASIDNNRSGNLSSALRVYVLKNIS